MRYKLNTSDFGFGYKKLSLPSVSPLWGGDFLSKARLAYLGLLAATMAALCVVSVHAGDGNPGTHGIIRALFLM
jgi:hypothetical protein